MGESFCRRRPFRFYVRVHNDAVTSSTFRLRSCSRTPARVRYHYRGTDITGRLKSSAGFKLDIPSGRYRKVTMDLTLGPCPYPSPPRARARSSVQAVGHPRAIDRVQAWMLFDW